jgi:hypothetical protein
MQATKRDVGWDVVLNTNSHEIGLGLLALQSSYLYASLSMWHLFLAKPIMNVGPR